MDPQKGSYSNGNDIYATVGESNQPPSAPMPQFSAYGGAPYPPPYDESNQQFVAYYAVGNNHYGQQPVGGVPGMAVPANNANVIVVNQPNPQVPAKESFCCSYFWSCMVLWFCWVIFGGIAFILTALGSKRSVNGDSQGARKFGNAATMMNVIGLLTGCAAWGVLIWWLVVYVVNCPWYIYDECYSGRSCYYSYNQCLFYYPYGLYFGGCCYYN